ncbi:uncharacterized protein LOC129774693 [Toxorhynchites rutilus septentrionalis]|uniref:uncharacterized protein LOC129774693 n=1 Tax=Toxorhynchites rutilus septentrionalis TaxID=329112 RepID=UPI00247872F6|nr:uncharacterized protein LOC129774693 [Toxorhynchites rutilus septentrionalis]XP_055634530.1 uncharacterized protein LOC129774693 [Toxorhynchites rutilus septentrionalis]XP_055634531.1 uncharacterized protein LOC129774693 [Toxorhynchites rutilus septentrionalis]XP_055634532.1 uncharacterized protein LOC129774693 [Toxorhynchites rutilus septentrionalis]XP_055634533.1 uncharacterized protein LOC129774693 [Toxorhynchites rutilus septentrionalis]XP_055634534.1 uncharacterized protein LOC12977469
MNRSDGDKVLSNERKKSASKKKYSQTKNAPDSRLSTTGSGGLHSFFRWFRKDDINQHTDSEIDLPKDGEAQQQYNRASGDVTKPQSQCTTSSESSSDEVSQSLDNGAHSLSLSPSPVIDCNNLSKSSSCDSILSTATNGFAFVPPNCYEAVGNWQKAERVINPGPYTDSYKRRVRQRDRTRELDKKYELTLRKKYNIFSSLRENVLTHEKDLTLTRDNQKSAYVDLSLPNAAKAVSNKSCTSGKEESTVKKHRRTVSDSSKDRKAGAYVHVKGKRRAPPPPPLILDSNEGYPENHTIDRTLTNSSYGTLSPGSTLSRKKRPAPPPPLLPASPTLGEAISDTSLLEDKEIKAIIEGTPISVTPELTMSLRTTPLPGISEERTPGGLTEEQKQQLIDNIRKVQAPLERDPPTPTNNPSSPFMLTNSDVMKLEENFINTNGTRSPIHDYLYVEAVTSSTKPGIPTSPISPRPWYKRPISGTKHQESSLPFKKDIILKTIDKRKGKNKEKEDLPEVGYCRNSLIDSGTTGSSGSGAKFNLFAKMTEKSDDTKRREKDNEKRKSGIGIPNISELDREAAEIINKEHALKRENDREIYFSAPEQLVKRTQSFAVKPTENTIDKPKSTKELISKFEANSSNITKFTVNASFVPKKEYFGVEQKAIKTPSTSSSTATKESTPPEEVTQTPGDKNLLGVWPCPYCTLENPNWRIICEACERIKPYDKLSILEEPPLRPNHPLKKPIPEPKSPQQQHQQPNAGEWDKKTERVMKYFMPKTNPSVSNNSLSELEVPKKSFGQSKMLSSPKMGVKSLMNRVSPDKLYSIKNFNPNAEAYSTNKFDDEKLKENAVSPARVVSESVVNKSGYVHVNLDEVRNARIAKFSTNIEGYRNENSETQKSADQPEHVQDMDEESLEKEKERLREMIRAMNAKALADKYPVLQKPPANSKSPLVQRKNGFVSAIPVSAKSPSPLRTMSPKMVRKPPIEEHAAIVAEPYKLGAIKKSFIRKPEDIKPINTSTESKIINQEWEGVPKEPKASTSVIPETVTELNESKLVLTNDVHKLRYEAMDESQFEALSVEQKESQLSNRQKETVRQISNQLRSVQGVENFRNTLKHTSISMNRTNTLAINKLLRNLENAIGDGAHDQAAKLAMDLAKMKVSLSVTRQSPARSNSGSASSLTDISIIIFVKDKISRKGPLKINISINATTAQLKAKVNKEFGIPIHIQRWILNGRELLDEQKMISDYGIHDSDQILNLYIVDVPTQSEEHKTKKRQSHSGPNETKTLTLSDSDGECSDNQNDLRGEDESNLGATALPTIAEDKGPQNDIEEGWSCPLCTLINPPNRPGCGACSEARPSSYVVLARYRSADDNFIPQAVEQLIKNSSAKTTSVQLRDSNKETRNDLNRASCNRKSSDIFNILLDESKACPTQNKAISARPSTTELLTTSHIQVPEQKNIVMTAFASPNITRNKYRGVDNFNPNSYTNGLVGTPKTDGPVITTASPIVRAVLLKQNSDKPVKFGRNGLVMPEDGSDVTNHYMELVNLDSADLIANVDPFDCSICFGNIKQYEGIILRDCLHSFCKECLVNTINYSEEAEIKCPFMDDVYSCECIIQQREIKALITKDMYEAYLAKSIRQAESSLDNTFHCKTPNCRGWCIYEDNVNQFKCPVCTIVNCLTCRAIHDGLDCKQYQDRMSSDCDTNIEARRTKAMLQEMVDKGDAIMCPTCQVVMMKKWGCDWLKCSMCKTEICWVTRGPRWGPGGKGDTSGGCRCGVNGKKCHPDCNYCH